MYFEDALVTQFYDNKDNITTKAKIITKQTHLHDKIQDVAP